MWDDYNEESLLELEGLGQFLLHGREDGTYNLEIVAAYMKDMENYPDDVIKHLIIPSEYEGIAITELSAYDYNGEEPGGADEVLSVTVPDGIVTISGAFLEFTEIEEITLPPSVRELTGCDFEYCYSLKKVSLPNGLETIGTLSFCWCRKLREIELPESLKTVGKYAFEYCVELEKIRIPASVTDIGFRAFGYTTKLYEFTVDENNPSYASIDGNLYTKDGKTLIKYAQGKPDENFFVPEGVEIIADEALNAYDAVKGGLCALRRVILPKSLTSIDGIDVEMYGEPIPSDLDGYVEVGKVFEIKLLVEA